MAKRFTSGKAVTSRPVGGAVNTSSATRRVFAPSTSSSSQKFATTSTSAPVPVSAAPAPAPIKVPAAPVIVSSRTFDVGDNKIRKIGIVTGQQKLM